jgi:hypothetical protein
MVDFTPMKKVAEFKDDAQPRDNYKSRDGFVEVPVYRGFEEIRPLWELIHEVKDRRCSVLGGYVRYMCSPHLSPIRAADIDIYCPEEEEFRRMLKNFKNLDMTIKHENDLAVVYTLLSARHPLFPCPEINLIKPMREGVILTQGSLEEIINNFDFTVIRIGLLNPSLALADADFIHDENEKLLRLKNIHCPVSTFYRVMKYRVKGYWPPSHLIVQVLQDWHERDEDYRKEIIEFFKKVETTKLDQQEIDRMERLLRLTD